MRSVGLKGKNGKGSSVIDIGKVPESVTDGEIRRRLQDVDEDDEVTVSTWEAGFIEGVVYKNSAWSLTDQQRKIAMQILEKYS